MSQKLNVILDCDFEILILKKVIMTNTYIDETIFEELIDAETVKQGIRFICEAPVGSGKTTAIKKFITQSISKHLLDEGSPFLGSMFKFIFIVPTVNIAEQFCKNFEIISSTETESASFSVKPCVHDGAFKDFKKQMQEDVRLSPLIVTTYSTASKCLGSMVEYFYRHNQQSKIDECFLIIDEAHLLLQHSTLIETIRDFKHVGLLTATPDDISKFMVFKDFKQLRPLSNVKYERTIYLHNSELRTDSLLNQVAKKVDEIMTSNTNQITLVKIEDKTFCKHLKEKLDFKYKVYLYNSEVKEVVIDDDGKFKVVAKSAPERTEKEDSFIVVSTSCIQAGQSLNDKNLVSVFVQTPLDVISNVQQFVGRNRQPTSESHLFLHFANKRPKELKYEHGNTRYKSKFNKLKVIAWSFMTVDNWKNNLNKLGKIIDETNNEEKKELPCDDGKEFTSKKALYKHYRIKSLKHIPEGFEVRERWQNRDDVKTRLYRLCQLE